MSGPWESGVKAVQLGKLAEIQLGKMLQPKKASEADQPTPYLKAGSIAQLDRLGELPLMFASPRDRRVYGVKSGDLIVAEGGDAGRPALVTEVPDGTIIQNSLHRVRPMASLSHRQFLRYALEAIHSGDWLEVLCNKSTFGHLTLEKIRSLPIPAPPLAEQRSIADFLATETARIDALVAKKQALARLVLTRWETALRERLRSLDAPMMPLKRRWQVLDCKHITPTYRESGYPVVSPGDATPGRLDLSRCSRFVDEHDYRDLTGGGRKPERGTIIYSRNASIGIACYVDTDKDLTMGQDVCLIKSRDQNQLYLTYVLNTLGVDQLDEQKIGSTFSRVNVSQIVELAIPVPSPKVQRDLAMQFDDERSRTESLIAALERQIDLLREHRQALITAAVTGQMAVPGVAA